MKNLLIGLFICLGSLAYSQNNQIDVDLDIIDCYSLKIDEALLFGNVNDQLAKLGTPNKLTQQNQQKEFKSIEDIISIIQSSIDFTAAAFSGLEFWCFNDLESIPCKIDLRKLNRDVIGDNQNYNNEYSVEDFKMQYPKSFANTPNMPQSFFEMATLEKNDNLKHFILLRSTKSNADIKLMVEFTFKDDKLIYIFFANF